MDNNPLKQLADNPALLEAVKQKLLAKFDYSNIPKEASFQDKGIWITIQDEGRAAVLDVIKEIEALRTVRVEEQQNPAV